VALRHSRNPATTVVCRSDSNNRGLTALIGLHVQISGIADGRNGNLAARHGLVLRSGRGRAVVRCEPAVWRENAPAALARRWWCKSTTVKYQRPASTARRAPLAARVGAKHPSLMGRAANESVSELVKTRCSLLPFIVVCEIRRPSARGRARSYLPGEFITWSDHADKFGARLPAPLVINAYRVTLLYCASNGNRALSTLQHRFIDREALASSPKTGIGKEEPFSGALHPGSHRARSNSLLVRGLSCAAIACMASLTLEAVSDPFEVAS